MTLLCSWPFYACDLVGPYISVQGWYKGAIDVADFCKPRHWTSVTHALLHYQILNLPSMAKRLAADGNKQRLARTLRDMSNDPNRAVRVHDEAARLDVDVSELDLSPVAW